MRLKRFLSVALSVALLISLSSCAPAVTVNHDGSLADGDYRETVGNDSSTAAGDRSEPRFSMPGFLGSLFGHPSEPESPPPPEYNRKHRLTADIPALIDGLEMPVIGATGYASVELPLWPTIPKEVEDSEEPEDADPRQISSEPEASPDGSPETDLSASAPEKSTEPVWIEIIELDPDAVAKSESPTAELPESASSELPNPEESAQSDEPEEEPDPYEGAVAVWEPGTAFVILAEDGDWWCVARGDVIGWIEHRYCMINLPDVIPSILYDDTNSYASLFVSCGKEIPGVTGEAFYDSLTDNARLGWQEFMMPMLYSAARHICAAQHRALAEGNCLVIYQTFRPYDTQRAVVNAMTKLAKIDTEIRAGVSTPPWSMTWFINTGISNHQRGYALDVSMVKVYEAETAYIGDRPYLRMTEYEDYKMPTAMHELSIAAVSVISPGSSQLSETMNEPAIALRSYFTASGLSPLASEWWHFNDNAAMRESAGNPSNGRYFITECLSCLPSEASELFDSYQEQCMETDEAEPETEDEDSEVEPEANVGIESEPELETEPETNSETEQGTSPETESETESETDSETTESEPETDLGIYIETE